MPTARCFSSERTRNARRANQPTVPVTPQKKPRVARAPKLSKETNTPTKETSQTARTPESSERRTHKYTEIPETSTRPGQHGPENPPGYRNAAPDRGHPSRPEQHKKARTVTRSRYAEEAAPSAVRPAYFCSPRIRIAASRMAVSSNVTTPPSGPGSKWTPTHSLASCLPPK